MHGAASADYYLNLAQEDYYASGTEAPGYWVGHGAERLHLGAKVRRAVLSNLLIGVSPDGSQPLVQNAGRKDRQCAWDLTFSAPKSVSVLWALATPEVRREIEQIHQEAVSFALGQVEERAGLTRRGKGGAIEERAALAFAVFQHGTSRALDPQLHSHCLLMNAGVRDDGTTGALKTLQVFRQKMTTGSAYREWFSEAMTRTFHVGIEPQKVGFRVLGVPQRLCREFSKRRRTVEQKMQAKGYTGAVQAKIATLDTRPAKVEVPQEELLAQWRSVAHSFGWSTEQAMALLHREPGTTRTVNPDDGIVQALSAVEPQTESITREHGDGGRGASAEQSPEAGEDAPTMDPPGKARQHPAGKPDEAELVPLQSPAPLSHSPQQGTVEREAGTSQLTPTQRADSDATQPNDPSNEVSAGAPTTGQPQERLAASQSQILPGPVQPEGLSPEGVGNVPAAGELQDRSSPTTPQPLGPGKQTEAPAALEHDLATIRQEKPLPAHQQGGLTPLDQSADQGHLGPVNTAAPAAASHDLPSTPGQTTTLPSARSDESHRQGGDGLPVTRELQVLSVASQDQPVVAAGPLRETKLATLDPVDTSSKAQPQSIAQPQPATPAQRQSDAPRQTVAGGSPITDESQGPSSPSQDQSFVTTGELERRPRADAGAAPTSTKTQTHIVTPPQPDTPTRAPTGAEGSLIPKDKTGTRETSQAISSNRHESSPAERQSEAPHHGNQGSPQPKGPPPNRPLRSPSSEPASIRLSEPENCPPWQQEFLALGAGQQEPGQQNKRTSRTEGHEDTGRTAAGQQASGAKSQQQSTARDRHQSAHQQRQATGQEDRQQTGEEGRSQPGPGDGRHADQEHCSQTASSQGREKDPRTTSSQQQRAGGPGIHFAWVRMFPKAPFWSLASLVKVPRIVFPGAQPRWGEVHWEKTFRFLKISVQDRFIFPEAPQNSIFHGLTHKAVHFSIPTEILAAPPEPKWGHISWKETFLGGEVRVQERNLFRRAPKWSPVHGLKHKALRFTTKISKWKPQMHQARQEHSH